jgi:hypothetical protein
MRKALTIIFLAMFAGNASAAWTVIAKRGEATLYAEPDAVIRSGSIAKMWVLYDYPVPQSLANKPNYSSMASLMEFDCPEKKARVIQTAAYQGQMREGALIHAMKVTGEWTYIQPGTWGDFQQAVACKKK